MFTTGADSILINGGSREAIVTPFLAGLLGGVESLVSDDCECHPVSMRH